MSFQSIRCVHRDKCKTMSALVQKEKEKRERNESRKEREGDAPSSVAAVKKKKIKRNFDVGRCFFFFFDPDLTKKKL